MDTKEYLEANNIQYAKDCKQCELQKKCIECYNAKAYRFWNEEPWFEDIEGEWEEEDEEDEEWSDDYGEDYDVAWDEGSEDEEEEP